MAKRKRDTPEDDDTYNWGDKKLRLQRLRLEQRVQHGVVLLHRALKVARGFERQKLGRREKAARQESDRTLLNRHLNEVEALKALDLHKTGERYLIKQMAKTKRIAESAPFIHLKLAKRILETDEKKSDAEANVTARLFNSNPVKKILPELMSDIKEILGLAEGQSSKRKDSTKDQLSTKPTNEDVQISDDEEMGEASDTSQGGEGVNFSQLDGLVASGSESEDDVNEDTSGRDETTTHTKRKYNPIEDLSLSPTPSIASDDSETITAKRSKIDQKATTATTFLPTLMGGYWSGSESEPEDDDPSAAPVRKNRMGQQARRKLWEKKYGTSANHIQKQAKDKTHNRDSGWDMRRGATSQEDTRGKYGQNKLPGSRRREAAVTPTSQGRAIKPAAKAKQVNDDKPLHPSWQAAMKRKETNAQTAFKGKKVVFD